MANTRYSIEPQEHGRWVIANARVSELMWTGGCWSHTHPLTFGDQAEAEEYAKTVFAKKEESTCRPK